MGQWIYLALVCSLWMPSVNCQCANGVARGARVNCGFGGMSGNQCRKGCCWDNSVGGVPWCFYTQPSVCSTIDVSDRANCAPPNIDGKACLDMGCCYDRTQSGVPWCFRRETICQITHPRRRVNCGFPGITQAMCKSRGCCWNNSRGGTMWCFHKQPESCFALDVAQRIDCGHPGITAEQCYDRGCCWDASRGGVYWCFNRP